VCWHLKVRLESGPAMYSRSDKYCRTYLYIKLLMNDVNFVHSLYKSDNRRNWQGVVIVNGLLNTFQGIVYERIMQ